MWKVYNDEKSLQTAFCLLELLRTGESWGRWQTHQMKA